MRITAGIKVLRGLRRGAVYDVERGLCWPATDEEIAALVALSRGSSATASVGALSSMRQKGWLERGAPRSHNLEIESVTFKVPDVLEHVWLEVTNSCNLQCNHCYASSGPEVDRTGEMTESEWTSVVDQALEFGVRKITFIGGEPTIRIDLVDGLSAHIKRKDPSVTLRMFSNLSIERLRAQTIDVVERHHIEFGTALYGIDAAMHDRMTNRKGSFYVTVSAIDECVARGVDVFVGMYLNMSSNEDIAAHEEWLRAKGVKRFQVLAPSQVGRGIVVKWKNSPRLNKLPGTFTFSDHQWTAGRQGHNCYYDHFSVMPDGRVTPCIMTRDVSYGSVREVGVRGVLSSQAFTEMSRLSKDRIPGCRDCEFRYACFDCRPDAMEGSRDYLSKPKCGYDPRVELGTPIDE